MTDYRIFAKLKLDEIERKRAELDNERERFLSALSVLDEADSNSLRTQISNGDVSPKQKGGALIDTLLNILRDQPMTANDLYGHVTLERETSKPSVHTALHRLRKRGKIFKEGNLWGLVEPTASTEQPPLP